MTDSTYAVIMAGGGGTRLWPLSLKAHPKQTLSFGRARTLFQMAIDRLDGLVSPANILVVTVADQAALLREQASQLPPENFLIEPLPRGTASVVGLAAVALQQRDPLAEMVVLSADHFIENVACFQRVVRAGLDAARLGYLVTLGITPTFASTGYGYIQYGELLGTFQDEQVFLGLKFTEKPAQAVADRFIAAGDYAWNSGMFIWTVERILSEIERSMPALSAQLAEIGRAWPTAQRQAVIERIWPAIHPETIDFGIMERAGRVAVVPAVDLQWNDVGSWDSLFDVLEADEQGNILVGGDHIAIDSHNTLVISNHAGRLVATIGVSDLIVIDAGNALLICPRDQAQQVRQVVERLRHTGRENYL